MKNYKGVYRDAPQFSLHIQCSWRLIRNNNVIIASRDIYSPRTGLTTDAFDWDEQGSNRFDELIPQINNESRLVESMESNELGDFQIQFNDSTQLQVFVDDSSNNEHCRFFTSWSNDEHFVVTGKGIELS